MADKTDKRPRTGDAAALTGGVPAAGGRPAKRADAERTITAILDAALRVFRQPARTRPSPRSPRRLASVA